MKVLVTGATGFLGRSIVRALTERGHDVIALVRPAAKLPEQSGTSVTFVRGDLRQRGDWCEATSGIEMVVHAAAATGGGFPDQFASSVVATENLLDCLDWKALRRFVLISSFSVYDFATRGRGSAMDEAHPLETKPERRDPYTWTKLLQERLVTEACARHEVPLVSIRPGAIYGPGKDWDAGAAFRVGKFDLVFSPLAKLRLTHVENCADAVAAAVDAKNAEGVYNIVDDEAPSHARYHRLARKAGGGAGTAIYIPWWAVMWGGLGVKAINRLFFQGRARLPELLDYPRQQARWRPFTYPNARAKAELGWTPRVRLDDALREMFRSK